MLLVLDIQLRRFGSTSTSTGANSESLIVGTFIPQCFELGKIGTHREWSLWKMVYLLLQLKQPWSIALWKPIFKINPQVFCSVDIHHTCLKFHAKRIGQPWKYYGVASTPRIKKWRRRIWLSDWTIHETKFVPSTQGQENWSSPTHVVFRTS